MDRITNNLENLLESLDDRTTKVKASLHEHSQIITLQTELSRAHTDVLKKQWQAIELLSDKVDNFARASQNNHDALIKKIDNIVGAVVCIAIAAALYLRYFT